MRVRYSKMHGLGNDFVLINAFAGKFMPDADVIRRWSDRRTGIGFDQLLIIEPCGDNADFSLRIFNADGSEAQQCGNGARCAARFAWASGLSTKPLLRVLAGGKVMRMEALSDQRVRVDMGIPSFLPGDIPFLCKQQADSYELTVGDQTLRAGVVSMGNPHVVLQVDDLDVYPVARVGKSLQSLPQFPQSVNAGFMQPDPPTGLRLRVFERGAGETMACGSGACAAFAVAYLWRLPGQTGRVTQQGGTLDIEWEGPGTTLGMVGPAEHVYNGEVEV